MKTLNSSTRKPISLLPLLLVGGCSAETISTSFVVVGIMVLIVMWYNRPLDRLWDGEESSMARHTLSFKCEHCGADLKISKQDQGRPARCPGCGGITNSPN